MALHLLNSSIHLEFHFTFFASAAWITRAICSFCKVNESGSFHAKGNGQYGKRSQRYHLVASSAECRIGCSSSGTSTSLRSTVWWRLWSEKLKLGEGWSTVAGTKVFSSPIKWTTISPALQHKFRNSSRRDTGGCLPNKCTHKLKDINLRFSLSKFVFWLVWIKITSGWLGLWRWQPNLSKVLNRGEKPLEASDCKLHGHCQGQKPKWKRHLILVSLICNDSYWCLFLKITAKEDGSRQEWGLNPQYISHMTIWSYHIATTVYINILEDEK